MKGKQLVSKTAAKKLKAEQVAKLRRHLNQHDNMAESSGEIGECGTEGHAFAKAFAASGAGSAFEAQALQIGDVGALEESSASEAEPEGEGEGSNNSDNEENDEKTKKREREAAENDEKTKGKGKGGGQKRAKWWDRHGAFSSATAAAVKANEALKKELEGLEFKIKKALGSPACLASGASMSRWMATATQRMTAITKVLSEDTDATEKLEAYIESFDGAAGGDKGSSTGKAAVGAAAPCQQYKDLVTYSSLVQASTK